MIWLNKNTKLQKLSQNSLSLLKNESSKKTSNQ